MTRNQIKIIWAGIAVVGFCWWVGMFDMVLTNVDMNSRPCLVGNDNRTYCGKEANSYRVQNRITDADRETRFDTCVYRAIAFGDGDKQSCNRYLN